MNDIEETKKLTKKGRWETGFYCNRCKTFTNKYVHRENNLLIIECTKCHQQRILHYDHTGKDPFCIDHHLHRQYHKQLESQGENHEKQT